MSGAASYFKQLSATLRRVKSVLKKKGINASYLGFPIWFNAHERRGWFS